MSTDAAFILCRTLRHIDVVL